MEVTASMPMVKLCPFRDELDVGTVEFRWWDPELNEPELHALAADVRSYASVRISHEEATRDLAERWSAEVTTRWSTAGMTVTVVDRPA